MAISRIVTSNVGCLEDCGNELRKRKRAAIDGPGRLGYAAARVHIRVSVKASQGLAKRLCCLPRLLVADVGVAHSGADILVAEQFLDFAQILSYMIEDRRLTRHAGRFLRRRSKIVARHSHLSHAVVKNDAMGPTRAAGMTTTFLVSNSFPRLSTTNV